MNNTHELKKLIMGFDYVVLDSDGSIQTKQLERELTIEEMQKAVGGFVELLPGNDFEGYHILVNEEGNLLKLQTNARVGLLLNRLIKGNVLFVKKEFIK